VYTAGLPPNFQTSTTAGFLLLTPLTTAGYPIATDLSGNVVWYYDRTPGELVFLCRLLPGGNMLLLAGSQQTILRETDLAWTTVRETNVDLVNAQLAARGAQPILNFSHEAIRLPNGYTATIGHIERLLTNVQGPGTVDVLGDMVLVLDQNFNVVWTWNAFDFMDASRKAILGETCTLGVVGNFCPPFNLAQTANDWLHGNALYYGQSDGSLIISFRNQDWAAKIDYGNGAGTGRVLWRLGNQGDFTMLNTPGVASPWFSHQHDVEYEVNAGSGVMSLFDNGNIRYAQNPSAHSRGQVLLIDESRKTADIVMSADLGVFSVALGSAQRLPNGNYSYLAGWVYSSGSPAGYTKNFEVMPSGGGSGVTVYEIQALRKNS